MTNKTFATFGLIIYLLLILTSAEDEKGNYLAPVWFIIIVGIAFIIFYVLVLKRLWKYDFKPEFWLLLLLTITGIVLEGAIVTTSPVNGSTIIILNNVVKVANFLVYFWIISILWNLDKNEQRNSKI